MSRRRAKFTQAEVARAIRGAMASRLQIANVEIDLEAGKVTIITTTAPIDDVRRQSAGKPLPRKIKSLL